jgi:hypothetical protein
MIKTHEKTTDKNRMTFKMKEEENFHNKSGLTKRAPDAGDSAHTSSSFHALAFFWLDGFAVPAPAQVTQTVGWLPC